MRWVLPIPVRYTGTPIMHGLNQEDVTAFIDVNRLALSLSAALRWGSCPGIVRGLISSPPGVDRRVCSI
jgi:hypothetical protein